MENRSFYNEILTEHNVRPEFKHDLPDADIVLEGVNPSCGDDIFLKLKVEDDTERLWEMDVRSRRLLRISCWEWLSAGRKRMPYSLGELL